MFILHHNEILCMQNKQTKLLMGEEYILLNFTF